MRFEWDPHQAESNLLKHRVSFQLAEVAVSDEFAIVLKDEGDFGEERWCLIGRVGGVTLFIVYTERNLDGEDHVRIISARRATRHERRLLEG